MAILAVLRTALVVCHEIESVHVELLAAGTFHNLRVDCVILLHDPESDPLRYGLTQKVAAYFDGHYNFSLGETLQFKSRVKSPISPM